MPFQPRNFLIFAALILAGCSTAPKWPEPKATTDLILRDDRRSVLATVTLGDALHVVLPPPSVPGTQWRILLLVTSRVRQMTNLTPASDGPPGSIEIKFQAIRVTPRTPIILAAIKPGAKDASPDDLFTIALGIKRRGE